MPTVQVTGLNVISIYVSDLERAEAFYRDHLGFEKADDMPPGVVMKAGDVILYLEGSRQAQPDRGHTGSEFAICFACDSVRTASEELRKAGVTFVSDYEEHAPTFAFFQIEDADGNVIEFAGAP